MTKPKLVLLVGAGASETLGLPGVKALSDVVVSEMRINDGYGDLRKVLPEAADQVRRSHPPRSEPLIDTIRRAHGRDNFEYDINLLENLVALSKPGILSKRVQSPVAKLINEKSAYEALFHDESLSRLLDGIISTVVEYLKNAEAVLPSTKIVQVKTFVVEFAKDFDLAIYNLNYDRVFDDVQPNLNDGFVVDPADPGVERFSSKQFFDANGTRLAHLHGSVSFKVSQITADGASEYAVVKVDPAAPPTRALPSYAESATQAGDFALIGSIIAGLRKPDKTRSEPYGSYSLGLDMDLLAAERVLIIGYGASDSYVNWQLIRARQYHGLGWKPVWITLNPLTPNDSVFQFCAWISGAGSNTDLSAAYPFFRSATVLQKFNQLHFAGEGWKPDDEDQVNAIKAALR